MPPLPDADSQILAASLFGVLGLLIGSFLNVVIYRLPLILDAQWKAECADMKPECPQCAKLASPAPAQPFNLMLPRSRCQSCAHQLAWFENIPLLSYLVLRGRCRHCGAAISRRYPLVELTTGALFGFCAWRWGLSPAALAWSGFAAALLCLGMIDWDTTLLPDNITLPLAWAGLIATTLGFTQVRLNDALWGAVAGYLSLWLVYWGFKLATGKDGMGFGDFKLFAALGAWFGWQALVPVILMASVIGAIIGIIMKFSSGLREGGYIPFGPFLAGAGITALVFGPQAMLSSVGL